ncbi:hypothetical protein M514_04994 [Trichuris suis]|uniref:Cation diffusion facilitator family transporter n=1 Tax=Trichuris suis TaxID=68888 RepID=A0A085NNW5_9BILA|nr:hypothetical protein M514_04994 [Trichuris suis]
MASSESESVDCLNDPNLLHSNETDDAFEPLVHYLADKPLAVIGRVNALKHLQIDQLILESEFRQKMHDLQIEYGAKEKPLLDKRRDIIDGSYEPTAGETENCMGDSLAEEVDEQLEEYRQQNPNIIVNEAVVGVPLFWLTALRNCDGIAETITVKDEAALSALKDIRCVLTKEGFNLSFYFAPNEYFTNTVLTKEYLMKIEVDPKNPLMYDGPELVGRKGCVIDWKPGKNLTVRNVFKRKQKSQRACRPNTHPVASFFNFFDPSIDLCPGQEATEEQEELLSADFDIARTLREDLIPRAVFDPVRLDGSCANSMLKNAEDLKLYSYLVQQPKSVHKRLNALKRVQLEQLQYEAEFWRTLQRLEKQFNEMQAGLLEKRRALIEGKYEPSEEEGTPCAGDSVGATIDAEILHFKQSLCLNEEKVVVGVPNFWLTVLLNCSVIRKTISKADEQALASLVDIHCDYISEPNGFVLSFYFDSNDYFSNDVLTKEYQVNCDLDMENPFAYDGPEVISRKGCVVHWKPGKNLAIMVKETPSKASRKPKVKEVRVSSFFDFFDPDYDVAVGDEIASTVREFLYEDFDIALTLRDRVLRRAVLYFTGEEVEDEESDASEETNAEENSSDSETSRTFKPARMGTFSGKSCRLLVMLVLTFSFFLVEIIFGYVTNSTALVADSFHMLSDVLALFIAFVCMKFSRRSPSSKNTFGWIRAEVLGALVNAVFLLALCFSIFIEGLKRLVEPEEIEHPLQILIVGVIGLVVNVIGIFMFHGHASLSGHGHSHGKRLVAAVSEQDEFEGSIEQLNSLSGAHNISVLAESVKGDVFNNVTNESARRKRDYKDPKLIPDVSHREITSTQMNMHGVFLHVLGDAFGSVIVILNAIICWQVDSVTLRRYLDPSLSLCLALIITCTTVPLLKESALILLQTVPTHINVDQIQLKLLHSIDGVLAVHELHIWRLAGNKIIATAHIHCRNLEDYMKIAEKVKEFFHREGIHSTTIQPEFVELADVKAPQEKVSCALECPGTKKECAPSTCCGPKTNSAGNSPSPGVSPPNVSNTSANSRSRRNRS